MTEIGCISDRDWLYQRQRLVVSATEIGYISDRDWLYQRQRLVVSATEHTSGESGKPYFVQSLCF